MESVNDAVSRYWTRVAEGFDGRASHVRHHAMWKNVLGQAFAGMTAGKVLDLGTGTGACAIIAAEFGCDVTAVDGSGGMLAIARQQARERDLNIAFVLSQIEQAKFEPADFDIVTLRNVLWTVADPDAVLRVAYSALRPGGIVFVSDGQWDRSNHRADYEHETARRLPRHGGLSLSDIDRMLAEAGFEELQSLSEAFELHPYEAMGCPPFFAVTARRPD